MHIQTQGLQLHAHDLYKLNPDKILALRKKWEQCPSASQESIYNS